MMLRALAFASTFACASVATAQQKYLDVHPATMTLGTTNPAAGEYQIDNGNAIVSVSPQCAGAHRCPLFVFLPGLGQPAQEVANWLHPVANKYGMLALTITDYDPPQMKRALTEALQHYAVDPARAESFYPAIRTYWPGLPDGTLLPDYSGIRPKLTGPGEPAADFMIDTPAEHGMPGLVHLFGIESPGLTASLSIAEEVVAKLAA